MYIPLPVMSGQLDLASGLVRPGAAPGQLAHDRQFLIQRHWSAELDFEAASQRPHILRREHATHGFVQQWGGILTVV